MKEMLLVAGWKRQKGTICRANHSQKGTHNLMPIVTDTKNNIGQ